MADLDDDLEPLVTECPSCATRFRVSETQLAAADGRVRCGACLNVFQGNAHLLFESELSGPDDPDADLDELLSDLGESERADLADQSIDDAPNEAVDEAVAAPVSEVDSDWDQGEALPTELPEVELTELTELDNEFREDPASRTESTAEWLSAHGPGGSESPVDSLEQDPQEDSLEQDLRPELLTEIDDSPVSVAETSDSAQDDAASPDTQQEDDDVQDEGAASALEHVLPEAPEQQTLEQAAEDSTGEEIEEAQRASAEGAAENSSQSAADETPEEIAAREQAEVEALLREYDLPQRRNWLAPVIVLGVIALTVEVFVLQFDDWVKEPSIRPVYEVACGVLPCTVEPLRDIAAIRSLANEATPDPEDPERMLIDLRFVSNAEFAQPFPTIEIQFRSRTGAPLGREAHTPEMYLQGDAAALTELAPRTPVRVTLSVGGGGSDSYIISYR